MSQPSRQINDEGPKVAPTTAEQRADATAFLVRTGNADLLSVLGLDGLGEETGPRCRYCSAPTKGGKAFTCGGDDCRERLRAAQRHAGKIWQESRRYVSTKAGYAGSARPNVAEGGAS